MLAYAFRSLNSRAYKNISLEKFDNIKDLMAEILIKGLSYQIKQGIGKKYLPKSSQLSSIRGKIDLNASIKSQTMINKKMLCSYDEFSANTKMNQIIKTTSLILIKSDISKKRKIRLRKLLVYLKDIETIRLDTVSWKFEFNRFNKSYRMLIGVCYLLYKGLIQTNKYGTYKLMDFVDDRKMHNLYEKFILEYYKKEHPQIKTTASQIPWQLDQEKDTMLPTMQSDIMLENKDKILIIDAKYYSKTSTKNFDKRSLISANIYQIFTYVKNKALEDKNKKVSGLVLYAKTNEKISPDNEYLMSGNKISFKSLDLNQKFPKIRYDLDKIIQEIY